MIIARIIWKNNSLNLGCSAIFFPFVWRVSLSSTGRLQIPPWPSLTYKDPCVSVSISQVLWLHVCVHHSCYKIHAFLSVALEPEYLLSVFKITKQGWLVYFNECQWNHRNIMNCAWWGRCLEVSQVPTIVLYCQVWK